MKYLDSDIIVIVYDMTQTAKDNNIDHWLEESNHHCPENTIKILVGNKIDLIEEMNKIHNCPIDQQTWKTLAAEKIYNYPVSCKTNEGIE
jgi:GTPase SAR1 family protein